MKISDDVLAGIQESFLVFSALHDPGTEDHSERTSRLCVRLADRIGMSIQDIENLRIASIFHDIGKVGVDAHVLNKPGELNDGEWAMVRMHPIFGCKILKPLELNADVRHCIRWHHENYDGSGYPDGLKADHIPLAARIIRIIDTYDALTNVRPYRPKYPIKIAMEILWQYQHNFDPLLLDRFQRMLEEESKNV